MWLQIWTLQVLLIPDPSGTSFILSFLFWFSSQRLGGEARRLQERIKLLLSHSRTDSCRARSPARLGQTGTPSISTEISRSMGHRCLHYPPWDIVNWAVWGEWRVQREGRKGKRCLGWDLPWLTFCSKLFGRKTFKLICYKSVHTRFVWFVHMFWHGSAFGTGLLKVLYKTAVIHWGGFIITKSHKY